jgi:zinc/manganese transport system ATP-binding protein
MQEQKIHDLAIVLENVDVRLGGVSILNEVNLSLRAGEFIVVLGPNGAGKTTLLKLLLGLIRPSAGLLQVLGQTPRRGNQAIGYVPQHRIIEPETPIRARDMVGFGLDGHQWGIGLPTRSRRDRIDRALKEVDALSLAEAPIGLLSGGEQQRLMIAQALLTDPQILLLDEPLANLDLAHQQEVVSLISRICRTRGVTTLLVSHDINPLLQVTDRVIFLAHGHSAIGAPAEVINSETLSRLYNLPVDVVQVMDRFFVVGADL